MDKVEIFKFFHLYDFHKLTVVSYEIDIAEHEFDIRFTISDCEFR